MGIKSLFEGVFGCGQQIELMINLNSIIHFYQAVTQSLIMIDSQNDQFCPFKIESQTPTETSSEVNGQNFSFNLSNKQSITIEDEASSKKQQNKLKYRKLKQKLNNMGSTHDEKCIAVKQIGGPSKQKIMKLALDFEKQVKMQNRDYYYLQLYSRELLKYIESRNQQQLHLLRQSRMMPAIFQLLQKVPMLHKNEFNQVLKTLETCFKMIEVFTVLSVNRDYLVLTNRLNNLISLINWLVGKQDKKQITAKSLYNFQFLCFKVVNVLLNHRCRQENADNVNSIINTTLQLVLCSQIFKKIKNAICEQLIEQNELQETELVQEMLKFLLMVLRKSHIKKQSIDSLISKDNEFSVYNCLKINPQLIKTIEFMLPSFIGYFVQVYDSELDLEDGDIIAGLPNITINILSLTMKLLNVCFQVSYVLFKKIFRDIERESLFSNFLIRLHKIIRYCKRQYEEEDANNNVKLLLNETIVFLGYIGLEDPSVQKKIYETLIFEEISNLPIQFMMDPHLRQIITPTICCLIYENKTTLNFLMKDNSPLQIIKYLRKQIQTRPSLLQRKNSTTSLMSLAPNPIESGSFSYELHRNQLSLRFPYVFWEDMCLQLQKHT